MLGKLIKYEFKATARWILPLFGGIILLSIVNKLMMVLFGNNMNYTEGNDAFQAFGGIAFFLTLTLYILLIVATGLITFGMMLRRFQANLMGDEGYLMFTLPVSAHQHMIAKLLTGSLWILASVFVTLCSVLILSIGTFWSEFAYAFDLGLRSLNLGETLNVFGFVMELLLAVIIAIPSMFLTFYLAIAFAYTRQRNRLLYGLGSFLAINFAKQVISMIIYGIVSLIMYGNLYGNFWINGSSALYSTNSFGSGQFHLLMILDLVVSTALAVGMYFATHHLLSKKLNID